MLKSSVYENLLDVLNMKKVADRSYLGHGYDGHISHERKTQAHKEQTSSRKTNMLKQRRKRNSHWKT